MLYQKRQLALEDIQNVDGEVVNGKYVATVNLSANARENYIDGCEKVNAIVAIVDPDNIEVFAHVKFADTNGNETTSSETIRLSGREQMLIAHETARSMGNESAVNALDSDLDDHIVCIEDVVDHILEHRTYSGKERATCVHFFTEYAAASQMSFCDIEALCADEEVRKSLISEALGE